MENPPGENALKRRGRKIRESSVGMLIPMMMLAGPLTGLVMGWLVIRFFEIQPPWDSRIKMICVLVGTAAGFREAIRTVKKIGRDD